MAWCHGFRCIGDSQVGFEAQTDEFGDTLLWVLRATRVGFYHGRLLVTVLLFSGTPRPFLKTKRRLSVTPCSWRPGLDRGGPGALGFGQPPLAPWGSTGGVAWCHGFSFLRDCQRAGRQIYCRASFGPNKSLDLASRCGLAPPAPARGTPNLESRWGSTSAYIQSGLDPPGPAHRTPNLDARWGPTGVKICPALALLPQDPPAGRRI